MSVLQSSILVSGLSDIERVVDELRTLNMGGDEGVIVRTDMNNKDFGGPGSDETPFVA